MPKNPSTNEKLLIGHIWINQRAPYIVTQIFGTTLGIRHFALIKRTAKLHKTQQK